MRTVKYKRGALNLILNINADIITDFRIYHNLEKKRIEIELEGFKWLHKYK